MKYDGVFAHRTVWDVGGWDTVGWYVIGCY